MFLYVPSFLFYPPWSPYPNTFSVPGYDAHDIILVHRHSPFIRRRSGSGKLMLASRRCPGKDEDFPTFVWKSVFCFLVLSSDSFHFSCSLSDLGVAFMLYWKPGTVRIRRLKDQQLRQQQQQQQPQQQQQQRRRRRRQQQL